MKFISPGNAFYFLRHAQTDHNLYQIYDDKGVVELNEKGIQQALSIQEDLVSLSLATVCSSPLHRVQQTKNLALKNTDYEDVILEDLQECPSHLWRLFLASEERALTTEESDLVSGFIKRVEKGLERAFQYEAPLLLIAHGGTYWALSHLLQLEGDKKIGNCELIKIYLDEQNTWKKRFIS